MGRSPRARHLYKDKTYRANRMVYFRGIRCAVLQEECQLAHSKDRKRRRKSNVEVEKKVIDETPRLRRATSQPQIGLGNRNGTCRPHTEV